MVKIKETLVIGAGIAGCAVALALAKRGIAVTIMTSPFDQRVYHAPFIRHDSLEEKVRELQKERKEQLSCSRAYEQLSVLARLSIDELLEPNYLIDRNGNIDIHRCLQDQLQQHPQVEWVFHHSIIELLTLDNHSLKKADRYKKPACIGVIAYNHDNQRVEYYLAKETILATGGASSLFPYSTHPSTACGGGIAIAYRAGARLLNMDQIQFHPMGLFEKERPCFPLPIELLVEGGRIYASKTMPLEIDLSSLSYLLYQFYDQLLKTHSEHLWLDLTCLEPIALKEKFPTVDTYCLNHGFNIVKDPLPIVPVAAYTCGGIAIDRAAQTTLQRLRAIGEVACTGLFWNFKEEALNVLESLTWALACADDIAKQVNKFIYYFPDTRENITHLGASSSIVEEDWKCLRQMMWSYVGIHHDRAHLDRGCALLDQLALLNTPHDLASCSIEQIQLYSAIQTAQLIAHSIRSQQGALIHHSPRPFAFFQRHALIT
jgi:L-aspartate oxidase